MDARVRVRAHVGIRAPDTAMETESLRARSQQDRSSVFPQSLAGLRVALVHDWLTGMRGGEKCLEVLCRAFPERRSTR